MAKNWTAAQAIKVIRAGKNKEDIMDIGRRFPLFAVLAASNPVEIVEALPDFISARKIEAILKGNVDTSSEDEDSESELDLTFTTLMGDKVEPRRDFIETNAKYVKNIDIS